MEKRYNITWKLRAIIGPKKIQEQQLAQKLEMSKQNFAYRIKNGFSISEIIHLSKILKVKQEVLL